MLRVVVLAFTCFWTVGFSSSLQIDDENVVVVSRHIPRSNLSSNGHAKVFEADGRSLLSMESIVGQEASLSVQQSGHPNGSGAVVPSIRGHSPRFTEVWLNGSQIVDPFTGLAFAEFDLGAFAGLSMRYGGSSLDLPSTNPVGSASLVWPRKGSRSQLGYKGGPVFGHKLWGSLPVLKVKTNGAVLDASTFASIHHSRGRYPFFDHAGTPFNLDDDCTRIRTNNDSRSWDVMPMFDAKIGSASVRFVGGWQRGERGASSPFAGLAQMGTRSLWRQNFGIFKLTDCPFGGGNSIAAKSLKMTSHISFYRGERRVTGPKNVVDTVRRLDLLRSEFALSSQNRTVSWHTRISKGFSSHQIEHKLLRSQDLRMEDAGLFGGMRIGSLRQNNILVKGEIRQFEHQLMEKAGVESMLDGKSTRRFLKGLSVNVGIPWQQGSAYAQLAQYDRPPTVLEQYGDGESVMASDELKNTVLRHTEVGLRFADKHIGGGVLLFHDRGDHTIVLLPSFGGQRRALNREQTSLLGSELRITYQEYFWKIAASFMYLDAKEMTFSSKKRSLPWVPYFTGKGELSYEKGIFNASLLPRYNGSMFKDASNAVQAGPSFLIDASITLHLFSLNCGIYVDNLTDCRSIEVIDRGGSMEKGRIGRGTIDGYPLGGRTFTLYARMDF